MWPQATWEFNHQKSLLEINPNLYDKNRYS